MSVWFEAGRAFEAVRVGLRKGSLPKDVVVIAVALIVATSVVISIDEAVSSRTSTSSSGNPPPEVSALKKAEWSMPGVGHRPAAVHEWPPFTGLRVALGGERGV